jgi:hypothetical protein
MFSSGSSHARTSREVSSKSKYSKHVDTTGSINQIISEEESEVWDENMD